MREAERDWQFARSETLELLSSLSDKKLAFQPAGAKWQPLSYQFACIGRTQLVYARALLKGNFDFSDFADPTLPRKQDIQTKHHVQELLEWSEQEWQTALANGRSQVVWPGAGVLSGQGHVYRLIAHERLHHGQLISYYTLAGFDLPKYFKQNWAL